MNKVLAIITRIIVTIVLVQGGLGLNLMETLPLEASTRVDGAPAPAAQTIQFTSAGHVLAFSSQDVIIASASHMLKIEFVNANPGAPRADGDKTPGTGDDKAAPFDTVTYENLWNGVKLAYGTAEGAIAKSTYYLDSGDAVENIHLRYNRPVAIDSEGNLLVTFEAGTLKDSPPVAWQETDNGKKPVAAAWEKYGENEVGFSLGDYIPGLPVIIDPWLTFLGFSSSNMGRENGFKIVLDLTGNVYLIGSANATSGSPIRAFNNSGEYPSDAVVVKLDPTGKPVWNTFLGGSGNDGGLDIALDIFNNVYVVGASNATWGAPVRAFTETDPGTKSMGMVYTDTFVAVLNQDGKLQWNTFLGGSGNDMGRAIALGAENGKIYIYVTGDSMGNWGTPIQSSPGCSNNAFIAKLDSSGNLKWNTFTGGCSVGMSIKVNLYSGNVYVMGMSTAAWGSPVQTIRGSGGSQPFGVFEIFTFVAMYDSSGTLKWNTFILEGNHVLLSYGWYTALTLGHCDMAVDAWGNVYVTGRSDASWGNPVRPFSGGYDAYAAKLDFSGKLVWNTFLGGGDFEEGHGMALGADKNFNLYVYVTGSSKDTWGTPVRPYSGDNDAFAAKLDASGNLLWNTFLGSGAEDEAVGITVNLSGNAYIAGGGYSSWGKPLQAFHGPADFFLAQLDVNGAIPWPDIEVDGNSARIANGNTSLTASIDSYFGNADVDAGNVIKTFTIKNNGTVDLILSGTPKVSISGTNASDFTVTAQPTSPVIAGGSTTFQVTFDPASLGVKNAIISIANNDLANNPFTFAIQGRGTYSLTVNGITANNKVFDGTTNASLNPVSATLAGIKGSDNVYLDFTFIKGAFADKEAGSAKKVIVSGLTLNGLDAANYTLSQPTTTASITAARSTLSLTSSSFSVENGKSVTFTARVLDISGIPTGTVTFKDGTTALGTTSLISGQATYATSTLTVGTHYISAVYNGDNNYIPSSAEMIDQMITKIFTTTSLAAPKTAVSYGQSITLTAMTSASSGTPTGTVTFIDGLMTLGSANLSNGQAVFSTAALTAGSHTLVAIYQGDTNYYSSTAAAVSQTIDKISPAVTLVSSSNPSSRGQTVKFTATVATATAASNPTGTVTFVDGITELGTVNLVGGTAVYETADLSIGNHGIMAGYSGDSNYKSNISNVVSQSVNRSYVYGQTVTFTVAISSSGGIPIGTVMFQDGNTVLGTADLSNGQSTFSTATLTVGTHSISALYGGNLPYRTSYSSPFEVVITKAKTATIATASTSSISQGQAVTLTAVVSVRAPGAGTPTGTVTFKDGSTILSTIEISDGQAVFSTSQLGVGSHTITVTYSGDANFTGSTATLNQTITSANNAGK
jgi:hypothetical protein